MNKKLSIVLIILLSTLLILVVGGMIFLMNNSSNILDFKINTIGIHTGLSKKLVDEKEITDAKPLDIEFDAADVFVKVSETNTIKVELYGEDPGEYEITESLDKIKVVLKNKEKNHIKWGFNIKQNNIKIYLPANYAYMINAKGTAGDISIDDFSSASLNAELTSGDVEINQINYATIALKSGDVEIESAYDVKTSATSGDVEIGTVRNLEVSTTTGDVDVSEVDTIKAKTTTGDYTIGIVNVSLDIETTTGDISILKANITNNSRIKATTGDVNINNIGGSIYVDASASTGDVKVKNSDRKSDVVLNIHTTTGDINVH